LEERLTPTWLLEVAKADRRVSPIFGAILKRRRRKARPAFHASPRHAGNQDIVFARVVERGLLLSLPLLAGLFQQRAGRETVCGSRRRTMIRKFFASAVVLAACLGVCTADEIKGRITKISDTSVSIAPYDKEAKKLGDAKSYPLDKDAKFFTVKKDGDTDVKTAVEGGVKGSVFQKIPEDGLPAAIEVKDSKVVEVRVRVRKS
jgi:hypothetical protein